MTPAENLNQLRDRDHEDYAGAGARNASQHAFQMCTIKPIPMREKQRAVLGVIGIYLARTLASNGSPEVQPIKVSRPSATVSDAQINGIIRKRRPEGGSSATDSFCLKRLHLSTAAGSELSGLHSQTPDESRYICRQIIVRNKRND